MARSSPPKIHHDTLPQAISTSHPWPLAAELLHHYIMDVTGLLQPVIYTRNFYSIVYVPRALVGAGNLLLLGHAATPSSGDRSIFYSLLATSALHLRNTGAGLDLRGLEMDRVGRFCRAMAYRYLRSAMAEALSDQDALQTTMSAVLSLITIDVMDGGMSEFWVHLNAFKWLSRHQSRMQIQETTATSQTETYLNTIFYFQSTLSLTTDCTFIPVPWPADSQRSAQLRGALFQTPLLDDHCLQHTYGVTRKLVVFIRVIAVLFQSVSYYISCGLALPETLEQTLADLSNRLDAWDLNSERNLLHFDGSDESTPKPRVLRLHILAFSHAIRIFHLTHLVFPLYQGKEALQQSDNQLSEILQSHVSQVSSLLHMIEEIKRTSNNGSFEKQVAPILWPGFIASCEADSSNQESWAQWWNHMSAYRIGNIQSLRRIVEGVWRVRDESNIRIHGDLGGFFMPSWRALLVDEKRRILAL
ncbi:fungal-specific transcription factor domain-containing protein [Aspergillus cavernicola]|uniref:Fungal-specific transcription factor domain-containing protein n=1 Tax=Aspergillus cavernicola TaxID=176166 RepID=A0ABR4IME9_9EURO